MSEVLIRGYKAKEQIEEIIEAARYGSNNCMVGDGLTIDEIPPHGDLIDKKELLKELHQGCTIPSLVPALPIFKAPVVIPASKEASE